MDKGNKKISAESNPSQNSLEKKALEIDAPLAWGALSAVGTGAVGAGLGLLTRAKYEDRFKKEKDKTTKDKLISRAPVLGALAAAPIGYIRGHRMASKTLEDFQKKMKMFDQGRNLLHEIDLASIGAWRYDDKAKLFEEKIAPILKSLELDPQATQSIKTIAENFIKKNASVSSFVSGIEKVAGLKKGIELREHQEKLIEQAHQNNGSILAAHATGVGKTLGGIATFEALKESGKASKALVVVPASLRSNFVDSGIKKFTDSSVAVYGPKNESGTKNIGDKSNATYNVVSYDLLREHGKQLLEDTGADTLIMDEVHRARATEGVTYNKLRDLRSSVKNAITLTGSVVNNDPNEIVPLLDITYGLTGHKLVSKNFFDKLFVKKDAKVVGILNTKTVIDKSLKNKPQLATYLAGKVSYVPHDAVDKLLPKKNLEVVHINMTPEQKRLYDFSMSAVDPVTRWKIRNNLPVGQKEAQDAFGQLMQARQISTDPSVLDKTLAEKYKDPADYSPKVKRVVEDLEKHLEAAPKNKSVIYGNLIQGQLGAVEKSLKARNIPYTTFYGVGNEGNTAKGRVENLKKFQEGDHRVLLISGAGAEGLDLKNANMLQMLEGHYNPERIHQAESRVRRMGSPLPEVQVKRYVSVPTEGKATGFVKGLMRAASVGGSTGVDGWIYSIAAKKDAINHDFRGVLDESGKQQLREKVGMDLSQLLGNMATSNDPWKAMHEMKDNFLEENAQSGGYMAASNLSKNIANSFGGIPTAIMKKTTDKELEKRLKQALLDRGHENLTTKKHYAKVLAESKMDERAIDTSAGVAALGFGLGLVGSTNPGIARKITDPLAAPIIAGVQKILPKTDPGAAAGKLKRLAYKLNQGLENKWTRGLAGGAIAGAVLGFATPIASEYARRLALRHSLGTDSKDLDTGIQIYMDKLRKKSERKYKSSKGFVNEFETRKDLGIDTADI